jgi:hypothetical protein
VFKDTLDESAKNGEFVTADELEADLGWDRSLIDGYLEKLRRESTLIGEENWGGSTTSDRLTPSVRLGGPTLRASTPLSPSHPHGITSGVRKDDEQPCVT